MKCREAFEKYEASQINVPYEELKQRLDEFEQQAGYRYVPNSLRHKEWLIWEAAWLYRDKELNALDDQLLAFKKVSLKIGKKIEAERIKISMKKSSTLKGPLINLLHELSTCFNEELDIALKVENLKGNSNERV